MRGAEPRQAGDGLVLEPNRKSGNLWIALALAAATAVAYWPVLSNGFVNYDDDLYVLNNHHIQHGLGLETIEWAFTTFRGANWFPLTWLSWALDFQLYGDDPAGFHATSLLLHIANTLLLFLAFSRMTKARWSSAFMAAIFALHPLHVESVAWAAARKDVLSGLFAMLALVAYERHVRRDGARLIAVASLLALGLMAKPTLVTWPFVLLLLDEWPLRRLRAPSDPDRLDASRVRRAVLEKLPLLAIVVVISGVAIASQSHWGTVQGLDRLPLWLRLANALTAYVAYLGDAFWPTELAVFYPHPGAELATSHVLGSGLLLAVLTGLALMLRRKHPEAAVGWFWFVGVLFPVIGLVQVGQAARADRYTYLPLIGLSLPFVFALARLARRGRVVRSLIVAASLMALLALGFETRRQVERWHDSESLFEHALSVTRRNHVAHINLGVVRLAEDDLESAATHLSRALQLAPASATAAGLLGDVRLAQERGEEALRWYDRALEVEPDVLRWQEGKANAELELGRVAAAIASYREALAAKPGAATLHANLGLALARAGRHAEAVSSFEAALAIKPELAQVRGSLGIALLEVGEPDRAQAAFDAALELDSELALIHAHAGKLRASRGEFEPALSHLDRATGIEPGSSSFSVTRAVVLAQAGRNAEAAEEFRRSFEIGERSLPAVIGLARLELAAGNPDAAISLAEEAATASGRRVPAVLALLGESYALGGRLADAVAVTEEAARVARANGAAGVEASMQRRAAELRARAER